MAARRNLHRIVPNEQAFPVPSTSLVPLGGKAVQLLHAFLLAPHTLHRSAHRTLLHRIPQAIPHSIQQLLLLLLLPHIPVLLQQ